MTHFFKIRLTKNDKQMIDYLKGRKVNISKSVRSSLYFLYCHEKQTEETEKKDSY